jgi:hypothetical protein
MMHTKQGGKASDSPYIALTSLSSDGAWARAGSDPMWVPEAHAKFRFITICICLCTNLDSHSTKDSSCRSHYKFRV